MTSEYAPSSLSLFGPDVLGADVGGDHDFYPTPEWCVDALLDAAELPDGIWCEPAVGEGAIVRAVEARRPGRCRWMTCDIRPDCGRLKPIGGGRMTIADLPGSVFHHRVGDFLSVTMRPADVYITNPPFSLAEPFARRCLELAAGLSTVALLLRLAFLESQGRVPFHREFPADLYPLARRPSFTRDGATDSTAYAWWVWGPGRGGRWFPPIGGRS